ncbi:hypothetical protein HYH02_014323 [Chlamydomonas schloesseri]|uniref:Uncharacterized protein n=1 Tax=Chlamydomonas schloesseri TaxID=2026947 RepID=A0A835VTE9_9CHLO|nr:hypothetical protein HYH02_014323 [Chlamydomonas schloesseri]|eukprot:KAG2428622.1 hypothetical protein HYH02_014323 [Chlamydomonas schloesseri]
MGDKLRRLGKAGVDGAAKGPADLADLRTAGAVAEAQPTTAAVTEATVAATAVAASAVHEQPATPAVTPPLARGTTAGIEAVAGSSPGGDDQAPLRTSVRCWLCWRGCLCWQP